MPAFDLTADDARAYLDGVADVSDARLARMLAAGLAQARRVAPCLNEPDFTHGDEAAGIILRALERWATVGAGATTQAQWTAGPYSQGETTTQTSKTLYWPSEINELQDMCKATKSGAAFTIDLIDTTQAAVLRPDLRFQYGWPGVAG